MRGFGCSPLYWLMFCPQTGSGRIAAPWSPTTLQSAGLVVQWSTQMPTGCLRLFSQARKNSFTCLTETSRAALCPQRRAVAVKTGCRGSPNQHLMYDRKTRTFVDTAAQEVRFAVPAFTCQGRVVSHSSSRVDLCDVCAYRACKTHLPQDWPYVAAMSTTTAKR